MYNAAVYMQPLGLRTLPFLCLESCCILYVRSPALDYYRNYVAFTSAETSNTCGLAGHVYYSCGDGYNYLPGIVTGRVHLLPEEMRSPLSRIVRDAGKDTAT